MSKHLQIPPTARQAAGYGALLLFAGLLAACGEKPTPIVPPAGSAAEGAADPGDASSARLAVVNFSPRSTPVDTPFNVQLDGNSGISFELSRPAPPAEFSVWFDDKPLTGVVASKKVVTATIPVEYLSAPGEYPIELEVGGVRLPAGNFEVTAR
jgi:hypothetical protein